ncbi:hypothetical protein B9G98_03562 [Wickerhamiella sorbophila]|uniref:Uncharacterized protein n=1 Tax=Wickerhamiella sorbophila TaxID=45607 RepID=A0A2T0FLT7_9ASCO|nr:hypothetical protein B9G98_03562 [Wickerhamiella sorbophila]PRT55942.1 hypothetical protein B9G98_03562 [Wickerhamiella sorbophila]
MASCSTTPFDNLGKRVNADRSHHLDQFTAQRGPQGLRQGNNANANAQFAQFAAGGQGLNDFQVGPSPHGFSAMQPTQRLPPGANADWANQFSREKSRFAALEQFDAMFSNHFQEPAQRHGDHTHIPLDQLKFVTPMLQPRMMTPEHLAQIRMNQPHASVAQVNGQAFDQAFAAAEAQIKNLEINAEPESEQTAPPDVQTHEGMRDAAASILKTVANSEIDDPTVQKMRSTKFMSLMEKLKSEEVKIGQDNESFVTQDGDSVKIEDMEDESSEIPRPRNGETGPEYVDRVYDQLRMQAGGPRHGAPRGQAPLEDPFVYLDRIKTTQPIINSQPGAGSSYNIPDNANTATPQEERTAIPSPFEAANLYGPGGMSIGDWEEHYDDAVWVPGNEQLH